MNKQDELVEQVKNALGLHCNHGCDDTEAGTEAVLALIEQVRQEAVGNERLSSFKWANENKHDLGEFGDFVRIEYLRNYCRGDFSYRNGDIKKEVPKVGEIAIKPLSSKKE